MLEKMGVKRFAYDYRAEHVPTFDAEMEALKRHGIQLDAWWFPTSLGDEAKLILDVLKRHKVRTQLWVTGSGGPTANAAEQAARVEAEAARERTRGSHAIVDKLLTDFMARTWGDAITQARDLASPL